MNKRPRNGRNRGSNIQTDFSLILEKFTLKFGPEKSVKLEKNLISIFISSLQSHQRSQSIHETVKIQKTAEKGNFNPTKGKH